MNWIKSNWITVLFVLAAAGAVWYFVNKQKKDAAAAAAKKLKDGTSVNALDFAANTMAENDSLGGPAYDGSGIAGGLV